MARKAAYAQDFDREQVDLQTRRNLEALALEGEGRTEEAIALYEQNIADGFEGDWPYGRLVAYYERQGRLDDAQRVLERGIEVFNESKRRTPLDRRSVLRAFKGRLKLVLKRVRDEAKAKAGILKSRPD
jgi:tetratricopeptide (TPR) repeat protein